MLEAASEAQNMPGDSVTVAALTERQGPLWQLLVGRRVPEGLGDRLTRDTAGSFALRLAFSALSVPVSIVLARVLGRAGYGIYSYALAWVAILCVPAVLGMDQYLVRSLAAMRANSAWGAMRGLLRRANRAVLVASTGLGAAAALLAWALARHFEWQALLTFWLALLLIPLTALTSIRQASLQGLHVVVGGALPERVIRPALFLAAVLGAYWLFGKGLTPAAAMALNGAAAAVGFLVGAAMLRRNLPEPARQAAPVEPESPLVRKTLPLMSIAIVGVVYGQVDVLILGAMSGTRSVGVYAVATAAAGLTAFLFTAMTAGLAPTIARLHELRDTKRLQRLVTSAVRVTTLLTLPIALGLIVFGRWLLLFLYGKAFVEGQMALSILTAGEFINVMMGPVGLLLLMTGHERDALKALGAGTAANAALNAALIPVWGLMGAAVAVTSSVVVWNCLMAMYVVKRLGIHATVFGARLAGS